jgi:hypothetical protein
MSHVDTTCGICDFSTIRYCSICQGIYASRYKLDHGRCVVDALIKTDTN